MTDDQSTDDRSTNNVTPVHGGNQTPQPTHRPWRQLAEAVLRETDHNKIVELAQELCDAVDEQVLGHGKGRDD
jgi:hypothetical protein